MGRMAEMVSQGDDAAEPPKRDPIEAALSIMRRMPPNKIAHNLNAICNLIPEHADELLQRVDQPLEEAKCTDTGRAYLLCDYNQDGDSHRFKRLGFETFLGAKQIAKHLCKDCNTKFDSEIALKSHRRWCRKYEDMTVEEQIRLRRTRVDSATRRGETTRKVEMVWVFTCENAKTKPCGLCTWGSKIDTSTSATPEIRQMGVFRLSHPPLKLSVFVVNQDSFL